MTIPRRLILAVLAGPLLTAPLDAQTWQPAGAPVGGFVRHMAADGQRLFAGLGAVTVLGSANQVFVSDNDGETWRRLTTLPGQPSILSIAAAPGDVWLGTSGGGLLRSTDGGKTWTPIAGPDGQPVVELVDAQDRLLAVTGAGALFESRSAGETWTDLDAPANPHTVYAEGPLMLSAGQFGTLSRSTDGGETWTSIPTNTIGLPLAADFDAFVRAGGALYADVSVPALGTHGIFRSDDDGLTWVRDAPAPENTRNALLTRVGDELMAVTVSTSQSTLWRREAGGQWSAITGQIEPRSSSERDFPAAALGARLFIGLSGAGVLRSDPGVTTLNPANDGLFGGAGWATAASPATVLTSPINSGQILRREGGEWSTVGVLPGGRIIELHWAGGDTFALGFDGDGLAVSRDAGRTWSLANTGVPQYNGMAGLQYREIQAFATDPVTPTRWFAGTGYGTESLTHPGHGASAITGGGIIRSTNAGSSWTLVNAGLPVMFTGTFGEPKFPPVLAMSSDGQTVLAGLALGHGVYRSTNGGSGWTSSSGGLPIVGPRGLPTVNAIAHVGGRFVIGLAEADLAGGGVFVSDDGGATWQSSSSGLPVAPVNGLAVEGGRVIAALAPLAPGAPSGGVYVSDDRGDTWQPLGEGLPGGDVKDVAVTGAGVIASVLGASLHELGACYADCDGNSALDIFDFLCFQDAFSAGDPLADCDGNSVLDIFDFLCFQDAFSAGCE